MKYTMELCSGRHNTPADVAIFDNIPDPTDTAKLFDTAWDRIPQDCDSLNVYVTGLTVAMLAVVKVCERRQIDLTAYHFNRDSGEYYPQDILSDWTCGFCGGRTTTSAFYCCHCGAN